MKLTRGSRSFTLIEVIAAVALLSLALLGIVQGQAGSVQSIVRSEALSQAYLLAQDKMTELELELLRTNFEALPAQASDTFKEPGLENFRWTTEIEAVETACFMPPQSGDLQGDGAQAAGVMGFAQQLFDNHTRKVTVRVEWLGSNRPLVAEFSQIFVRFADLPQFNLN